MHVKSLLCGLVMFIRASIRVIMYWRSSARAKQPRICYGSEILVHSCSWKSPYRANQRMKSFPTSIYRGWFVHNNQCCPRFTSRLSDALSSLPISWPRHQSQEQLPGFESTCCHHVERKRKARGSGISEKAGSRSQVVFLLMRQHWGLCESTQR